MNEILKVHIYPSDCDSVGHVNHAHMLTLLERARWSALERHMSYRDYMKSGLWAVVRKVEASYEAQTFPGDDLSIRTGMTSVGNTSFVVRQEVRNQRDVVVCNASIVYVTVSNDGKPIPVPDQWRTLFAPWEEEKAR
ncbi:MAG TPA: thioesterase family protein [Gemmatimonadaceae bacterium]|jgi:YbgC/YbaW family acyl-CoA thioester hydrolase|nr:thioesterase family protein [Gemmatimonadaceae bacterium]